MGVLLLFVRPYGPLSAILPRLWCARLSSLTDGERLSRGGVQRVEFAEIGLCAKRLNALRV